MSGKESVTMEKPLLLPSYPKVGPRANSTSSLYNTDTPEEKDKTWGGARAHTENIASVMDNPFYKSFGRKHHIPAFVKTNNESFVGRGRRGSTSGVLERDDDKDDDIGEYRPGSGFVHKLLDKFSSMSSKDVPSVPDQMKRSTGLEELPTELDTNNSVSIPVSDKRPEPVVNVSEKPSNVAVNRLSYSQRAKSIESLNHVPRRPHHIHSHHHHRPPHLAVPLRHVETKKSEDKQATSPRSPRDSHVIAPDVDLARDDIIIIETTPSAGPTTEEASDSGDSDSDTGPLSYREEQPKEELPKPNTVFNVRSIFENATVKALSRFRTESKKPKVDSTSPYTSPTPNDVTPDFRRERWAKSDQSSQGNDNDPSASSDMTSLPPTPRVAEIQSQPSTSIASSLSPTEDTKHSVQQNVHVSSPFDILTPQSDTSEISDTSSTKGSVLERRSMFDSPRYLASSRPLPSPRNTASVKPTIGSSKPMAPVKPAPLNIPASTAINYKKSSPVVTVAPFKENKDETKDDGQPVMIFDKSKLSSQRNKPKRTKVYTPVEVSNTTKSLDKKDLIIAKDSEPVVKSDFPKQQGEQLKNGRPPLDIESDVKVDEPKIIQTEQKTIIELKKIPVENKIDPPTENVESVTSIKENTTSPVRPVRPSRKPRTEPAKPSIEPPKLETEKAKGQMLYVSSSETSESDATPPVTPRSVTRQEENQTQPIKGIPSIIAQRLKNQNSDPRDIPSSVALSPLISNNESTSKSSAEPSSETARPGFVVAAENKKPVKDEISNEIESEIAAVRKKMEGNRSKSTGVAQIFDSSQLAKKRKENQRRRQENAAAQGIVPPLDLSSINDNQEYRPPVSMDIKPCNIVFIGENAATERSLLKKQRTVKVNIRFNDAKTETFEYPREEAALEAYLQEFPHETSDVLVLDDFGLAGESGESSDDAVETVDVFETPVTPRGNADDDLLKSNTSLSHSGTLQSYRSKYQEDFQFGSSFEEPAKPAAPKVVTPEEPDPESMMLRPAQEDDSNIWSTNDSSDLLF